MRARTTALVVLVALAATPAAAATELSSDALRSLAARALDDRGALRQLRAVDSVDGIPVDINGALEGAGGARLESRLRLLAGGPNVAPLGPEAAIARARARSIVAGRRFRPAAVPRPFKGALEYLGRRLSPLGNAIARAWNWLAALLPGGDSTLWVIVGPAAVIATLGVSARVARRRARAGAGSWAVPGDSRPGVDPVALERAADAAERAGDLRSAVRFRFQAGLLRLDRARVIDWRPSLSTTEIARRVRAPEFASLSRAFDEIVYGGRQPRPEDVASARREWTELLGKAA